jgi:hypothetical protein
MKLAGNDFAMCGKGDLGLEKSGKSYLRAIDNRSWQPFATDRIRQRSRLGPDSPGVVAIPQCRDILYYDSKKTVIPSFILLIDKGVL